MHRPWNKGLSKETNESIKKMSDSKKDQKSWNKNLTKENDERVKKMSDARKGIIFSNSHLDNLRQSHIGLKYPNRKKNTTDAWNKGLTKETDERVAQTGKKISIKTKGTKRKDRIKFTCRQCGKIKYLLPCEIYTKQYCSILCKTNASRGKTTKLKGQKRSKENRENNRLAQLKRLSEGKGKYRNTSIEIAINSELLRRKFIENKDYFRNKSLCKRFNVDFYFPLQKIVIECDGDYWHNREDIKAKDKIKNKVLQEQGYILYRFWEHDINESSQKCIDQIIEFI